MQSLILFFFFFFFFVSLAAAATYRQYSDCAPTPFTCGNLTVNVEYPFRIRGRLNYCGFPGFDLSCIAHNSTPIITIENYGYKILAVDYTNKILTVVDTNLTAPSCPKPHRNTTLDESSLYRLADSNQDLTFFADCVPPDPLPSNLHDIRCLDDGDRRSYYSLGNRSSPGVSEGCGSTVVVQVDRGVADRMTNGVVEFGEALREGFSVWWMPGKGWCRDCVYSGGVCGFNYSYPNDPVCYCPDGYALAKCLTDGVTAEKSNGQNILVGVTAGVAGAGLIVACFVCLLFYRRKRRRDRSSSSKPLVQTLSSMRDTELGSGGTHIFSYDELREATNCFDASLELGDGGFGTVYKGKLRDGRVVAVKRLYENNYKRAEQFINEVDILSRLRHQNLVTLYGCTSRRSRELLLVYEFVSNGTVADHLHGSRSSDGALAWAHRMRIAVETADALAYLHAVEPQIIHRDVKTTNILLDDGFHVKVGDFGLSRLFPLDATHVSTLPQGTPGYVDPEYHQCYQLTDKSDVYSFGVVLVELISSKPAVDISRSRNEINLSSMAINRIRNRELDQLVDPELGFQYDEEKKRMITRVADLAFRCLQAEKEMRPSIKEVLEELQRIVSGGCEEDKDPGVEEESVLLKSVLPFSPDSVTVRWDSSRSTTSNTSTG